jgi:hypothetical protein
MSFSLWHRQVTCPHFIPKLHGEFRPKICPFACHIIKWHAHISYLPYIGNVGLKYVILFHIIIKWATRYAHIPYLPYYICNVGWHVQIQMAYLLVPCLYSCACLTSYIMCVCACNCNAICYAACLHKLTTTNYYLCYMLLLLQQLLE